MRIPIRMLLIQALLTGLLTSTAITAMAAERIFDHSFTVNPDELLTVNADAATITVSGGQSDQVVVHMIATGSQEVLDALTLSASRVESGVTVQMVRPHPHGLGQIWGSWNMKAQIRVTVPRRFRVDLKTSGGDMVLSRLEGSARGETSGGDVRLEELNGEIQMGTSGGNVTAKQIHGSLEVWTSGGNIHLEAIGGPVQAHSSGGNVIVIGARGDLQASTSGGDVRLLGIDGKIDAQTSGGSIECELIGVNRGISTTTSGGSIRLTMAKNTAATLDAESSGGRIVTEFPVSVTTYNSGENLNGPVNGGGAPIYARTSGGDIELRSLRPPSAIRWWPCQARLDLECRARRRRGSARNAF